MHEIYTQLKRLQDTDSKNEKLKILKENNTNQVLKEVLHFLLNPYIVTGISTKKIDPKTV